jgi:hypothetical protein
LGPSHRAAQNAYGTNTPEERKRVLSAVVEALPSAPPSRTVGRWNAQIARMPAWTAPGTTELALVSTSQSDPFESETLSWQENGDARRSPLR